jgi:hypothetical protein
MRTGKSFTKVTMTGSFGTVICARCPHWFGYADSRLAGLRTANRHERDVHKSESTAAAARLSNYLRRHAIAE